MSNKILIIEDEESIRGFLKINFKRNNFEVYESDNGEEGLIAARKVNPDISIIDVMLPGMDGFSVCETLRNEFADMGIIMLTARGQDMDKIMGLELGADDYVIKPFNPLELILRVNALIRRISKDKPQNDSSALNDGIFNLDTYSKKAYKNNKEVILTPKEYLLLELFMKNPGKAFSRDELLNIVWGYKFLGDPKIVDVNIRRLRSKIEDNSSEPKYIETVWGTGYRWKKRQIRINDE